MLRVSVRTLLVLLSIVCFVLAALPLRRVNVRFEWLAFALLTWALYL